MPEEKANCQQIIIAHKCGGSFTIFPDSFAVRHENKDPRHRPMCLNCFEPLVEGMMARLESFCREYQETVKSLADKGFTMVIIQPENQEVNKQAICL